MKKYYILPKNMIAEEIESETAEEAVIGFATRMDSDMNQYFKASGKVMEKTWEGEYAIVFAPLVINPSLFNTYIEKKKEYKDGTNKWAIGIELKNGTKSMILDTIRGTKEEAVKRLEEFILHGRCSHYKDKRKYLETEEEETMGCEKNCLSCGNSFSEPKEDGNDVLHCMINNGKEVPDDGCCDDWN